VLATADPAACQAHIELQERWMTSALPVTSLWQVLGAIDDDERLTALGWWGLPEAMLQV
jgi:hypothetical protein